MAAWLRELIKEGHISEGVVDERSIVDVQPAELVGYRQCHFFAGIGGWSYALRLAGVPDDEEIWSGSCPASRSAVLGENSERKILAICGRFSERLFTSSTLQQLLANRLRAKMDVNGSPEYLLTWKEWDMPLRAPICALRASQRRTQDSGFIGWPTPTCPTKTNGHQAGNNRYVNASLAILRQLRGWNTPRATDGKNGGPNQSGGALSHDWATMGFTGVLTPELSRWLQGYPTEWTSCGATGMQSCRSLPRNSSKPSTKRVN